MGLSLKDLLPRKDITISQEAIKFQMHSALAKSLIDIFQMGIDAYDNYDTKNARHLQDLVVRRAAYLADYTKKTLVPKLKTAIYANTNLTLREVITDIYPSKLYSPQGFFAVDISFGEIRGALAAAERFSGTGTVNDNARSLKNFETLANAFDEESPMLKQNVFGLDKKRKIECTMYFDPVCAFCLHDYVPVDMGVTRLTAEEIAAIVCHEIGHTNTMIERCRDKYYQYQRISTAVADIRTVDDPVQFKDEASKAAVIAITTLQKQKMLSDTSATTLIRCIDGVNRVDKDRTKKTDTYTPPVTENKIVTFFDAISNLITGVFIVIFGILGQVLLLRWMISVIRELDMNFVATVNDGSKKVSDTHTTSHNLRLLERIADEFVSRNGLSGPLASSLNKLHMYSNYTQGSSLLVTSPSLQHSRWMMGYFKLIAATMGMLGWNDISNYTYEEASDRLFRMAQNTIKVMKDELPTPLRVKFISDYEEAMRVAKSHKGKSYPLLGALQNIVLNITNPSVFYRMVIDNKLTDDYKVLQDNVDKLTANKLYYSARKFQVMMR